MTWFNFLGWLAGLYTFYYMGNILWDMSRQRKTEKAETPELVFETQPPQQVAVDEPPKILPDKTVSPIIDAGGLRLRQLFSAAKAEMIVYTGNVTY